MTHKKIIVDLIRDTCFCWSIAYEGNGDCTTFDIWSEYDPNIKLFSVIISPSNIKVKSLDGKTENDVKILEDFQLTKLKVHKIFIKYV